MPRRSLTEGELKTLKPLRIEPLRDKKSQPALSLMP